MSKSYTLPDARQLIAFAGRGTGQAVQERSVSTADLTKTNSRQTCGNANRGKRTTAQRPIDGFRTLDGLTGGRNQSRTE